MQPYCGDIQCYMDILLVDTVLLRSGDCYQWRLQTSLETADQLRRLTSGHCLSVETAYQWIMLIIGDSLPAETADQWRLLTNEDC